MDEYALGVSEFTTWPWTFERDVEAYRRHGFSAIEITEAKLDRARLTEQFDVLRASGLQVASVQAQIHGIFATKLQPEPSDPPDRIAHIRESIEALAPHLPQGTPFVAITGAPPNGDIECVHETVVHGLRKLSKHAAAHGMRIALEPLNPSLMNVDGALWSLDDALAIVDDVGEPNCGVCVDTWNIWQNRDLETTLRRAGERIFLVQVSDYRRPHALYDRLIPGDGEIPLPQILQTLREVGYSRPYVIEIFSSESLGDSLWKRDLDDVLDASARGFRAAWERA